MGVGMLFVDNEGITDPRINLAIEEYLLRQEQFAEPILLFYINEPSVIIGRNQNTIAEIDQDFVKQHNIHVVRRLSGGGAVYHDLGNLNFSFVSHGRDHLHDFAKFTEPVVRALNNLGVQAELRGQSDIFAQGKKISGNAQYASGERMFSHGTLLFDSNLENLLKALNPQQREINSKAVQSIHSFVGNVADMLPQIMTIHELKAVLLAEIFGQTAVPTYQLTESDWRQINRLSEVRYQNWEWNVGRSPNFNIHKSERIEGVGQIDVYIEVTNGRIQQIKFTGDFHGRREIAGLEMQIVGLRYEKGVVGPALAELQIDDYIANLTRRQFLQLID